MKNLLAKIYDIQKELTPVLKSEANPYYKSKYFDVNMVIEHLMPLLTKHGVVVLQPLSSLDGAPAIKTILADKESGEMMDDTTPLPKIDDPQKMGSAVTYFRRYALTSLFLVQGEEDDDANATVKPQAKPQVQTPASAPTTQPSASGNAPKCAKCGAGMAISKRNGKEYCSALCWNTPKPANTVQTDVIIADEVATGVGAVADLSQIPF